MITKSIVDTKKNIYKVNFWGILKCVCVYVREREREHLSLASKSTGDNTKIDHISSNHELMKSVL